MHVVAAPERGGSSPRVNDETGDLWGSQWGAPPPSCSWGQDGLGEQEVPVSYFPELTVRLAEFWFLDITSISPSGESLLNA